MACMGQIDVHCNTLPHSMLSALLRYCIFCNVVEGWVASQPCGPSGGWRELLHSRLTTAQPPPIALTLTQLHLAWNPCSRMVGNSLSSKKVRSTCMLAWQREEGARSKCAKGRVRARCAPALLLVPLPRPVPGCSHLLTAQNVGIQGKNLFYEG
jgi:hypothetical protein